MNGIVLRRLGHNVHILERTESSTRDSQAAGIGAGPHVQDFLGKYDLSQHPFSMPCDVVRILNSDGTLRRVISLPRQLTSWDALYYRLRANFDGAQTEYCRDDLSEQLRKFADLVIAAGSASSVIKSSFLPNYPRPEYAGYVAWRGVVPENEVSAGVRTMFQGYVSAFSAQGEHMLVYHIPGTNGSLAPGSRFLNFVWYTPVTAYILPDILTDINGVQHRRSIGAGLLRPEVWVAQRTHAHHVLSPQFVQLIDAVIKQFVQAVEDSSVSRAVFANSRVILAGEALAVVRPHTAQGADNIAQAALLVGGVAEGKIDLGVFEGTVCRKALHTKWKSRHFGVSMMRGPLVASREYVALCLVGVWIRVLDLLDRFRARYRGVNSVGRWHLS
ncbi:MAG: hypothetical protein MMC23_009413 [Stictis urceolatum]|nr:hypothetical protein [Stictis urceolata]